MARRAKPRAARLADETMRQFVVSWRMNSASFSGINRSGPVEQRQLQSLDLYKASTSDSLQVAAPPPKPNRLPSCLRRVSAPTC
jgi:hypothetical protein